MSVNTLLKNNNVRIDEAQDFVKKAFLDFKQNVINGKYMEL